MTKAKKTAAPSDIQKAIAPDQSLFKYSLLSIMGSLAAFAIAAFLLYTMVINGSNRQLAATVFQSHADAYASYFNQKVGQLQNQLKHAATQVDLASALKNQNRELLTPIEKAITYNTPNLITVKLLPYSGASLNREKYQLSFREVDMVNRAEHGEQVPPEAHALDGEQIIRLVQVVNSMSDDSVAGVILASFSLSAITDQLGNFDTANGSMQLEQVFRGTDSQTLAHIGAALNSESPILTVKLNSRHWQVRFQPSAQLTQENNLSSLAFWLPLIFALTAVIISILISYLRLKKSVRGDAINLVNYCRELISGSAEKTPDFKLSLFHSMAKTLAYTEREDALDNPTEKPLPKETQEPEDDLESSPGDMEVDELLNVDLDQEEILDFDLVDREPDMMDLDLDIPELDMDTPTESDDAAAQQPPLPVPADIFRAYDIRGIVDESLNTDIAYRIGQAVGSEAGAQGENSVVVGADGRLSSPELCAALVRGLRDSGRDVINIGTVPTPLVYYATHNTDANSGVMITGSHNPSNYNGFKIVIAGNTLANDEIQVLRERIERNSFSSGSGALDDIEIIDNYVECITNDIAIAKPLKVVLDCGNGVASVVAPRLIEALGCEIIPLYCEIDGRFPNHHPDPGKPENLQDLIKAVTEQEADIGLAFDGDGDRVGVVTNKGNIIWPDRLMMLFAKDVASRNPGADIIYDVKCSRRLANLISNYGGRPVMWKTGHSLIKAKMRETGALLAGEMSGHIFFKERWFGFDDGIYSAARLLEILGLEAVDADTLFESFPDDISTPEINIGVTEESKFDIVSRLQKAAQFNDAEVTDIDGIRADFENGWGLVRASNTTPVLVLRFGADDQSALDQIKERFKQELLSVEPSLEIPF